MIPEDVCRLRYTVRVRGRFRQPTRIALGSTLEEQTKRERLLYSVDECSFTKLKRQNAGTKQDDRHAYGNPGKNRLDYSLA